MNSRQTNIVEQIASHESWMKGKELANAMGVTTRTIRSDIEKINSLFPNMVESSTRQGYKLNKDVYKESHLSEKERMPQTPKERSVYIIKSLLLKNKRLKFIDLEDELYVSEHTIEADIKRIRETIIPYIGLSLVRKDNSLYFEGDEHVKRKLYRDLLTNEIQGNFLNLDKTAALYKKFDLLKVISILEEILKEYCYEIRKTAIPMITVHIGITIERMLSGNYLSNKSLHKNAVDTIEYNISKEFFKRVTEIIPIKYDQEEVVGLARILRAYKDSELLQDNVEFNGQTKKVHRLLEEITLNIKDMFDLDFSKDKDFTNGLHLHIQSLVNRIKNESTIPNVHLQETKLSYPLIFEMGIHVGQLITDYFGFEISESEIGFIALHIGAAYDRLSKKHKYQVLLIAPQNESFLKLTKGKITNMFKDRMEIVAVTQYLVEKEIENSNIDLIISVLPIQHSLDIKTIEISMFVNHENESRIFTALNELDKNRFTLEFGNQFGTLLDERFYFTDLDYQTPQEVIKHMSDKLEKEKVVPSFFKESVLEREAMASTSFVYSLAIPHPLILNSEQSKIAIGILKSPIKWGRYNVKLVMMPAITEEDSSKMWLFFDWLSETITNAEKMTKLIESKNKNEFVHWMTND